MPRIVDKAQKRDEISRSCMQLVIDVGFDNLTVSKVAQNANISKGSIYNYFESKEDIIYSIIQIAQNEYDDEVSSIIKDLDTTKQKVLALFKLCISPDEIDVKRRKIYREFTSISLREANQNMMDYQKEMKVRYIQWLKDILKTGIDKNELIEDAPKFAEGLFAMAEGVLLLSHYESTILTQHIDELFKLLQEER